MRVVISSDTHKHAQLLPMALAGWKKYFPDVKRTVVLVQPEGVIAADYSVKRYTADADEVVFLNHVDGYTYENQCKLARMWQAGQYGDEVVTLEDADLVPLNTEFRQSKWDTREPGKMLLVGREVYKGNKRIEGRAPMSQVTAESKLFRELTNPGALSWSEFLAHCVEEGTAPDADPRNIPQEFSDESLLKCMLDNSTTMWARVQDIERGYKWPEDVIDRAAWETDPAKLASGHYKEAHILKPLYHDVHRHQMARLIHWLGLDEFYAKLDKESSDCHRFLIIQSGGEHEINKHMRECLSLQRAFQRLYPGCIAEVAGPRHDLSVQDALRLPDGRPREDYDTIVVMEQYELADIPSLKDSRCAKFYWSIDSHKNYEAQALWCLDNEIDMVLCATKPHVKEFEDVGLVAEWFPNCVDHALYDPDMYAERSITVGFCGHLGNRGAQIDQLSSAVGFVSAMAYGEAMVETLQDTLIEWNRNEAQDINYRTFEAAAAGCCVVTNRTPGITDLFEDDEIVVYDSMDDCVAKIDALKADPTRRYEIARKGRERVLGSHTYNNRAKSIWGLADLLLGAKHGRVGCTVALNMIVGPNDAADLDRCLTTFGARRHFDEVVIVVTTNDPAVWEVAQQHATKVLPFEWNTPEHPEGHFADARNTALDATTSDYVMWLDADDVCLPSHQPKMAKLVLLIRSCEGKFDVWMVPYVLICDQSYNPELQFYKERIFKRSGPFRWKYSCHELVFERWDQAAFMVGQINNLAVTHGTMKAPQTSAARNVRILEREYNAGNHCYHHRYFLAQDYLLLGRYDESVEMYTAIIEEQEEPADVLYLCALNLAYSSLYGHTTPRPEYKEIDDIDQAEQWVRLALTFGPGYAEPHLMLGDIYLKRGDQNAAERAYLQALGCRYGVGGQQCRPMYQEVPAWRLANIYEVQGEAEKALWYNSRSLKQNTADVYQEQRLRIIAGLAKELPAPA